MTAGYELVTLANGVTSVRSLAHGETFHPVIGPAAEAEALYVRQLRLRERLAGCKGEFVVWDVGLGAGANVLTALGALAGVPGKLRIVSFDRTLEALRFALNHADELGYLGEFRELAAAIASDRSLHEPSKKQVQNFASPEAKFCRDESVARVAGSGNLSAPDEPPGEGSSLHLRVRGQAGLSPIRGADVHPSSEADTFHEFTLGDLEVGWQVHLGDFPTLLAESGSTWPAPHAIMYDAYSPMRNPDMWTLPLFERLHQCLDPRRACALPTYSRSTILRVTLLLAGFFVGVGHATGEKEETTLAANTLDLLNEPLNQRWLERALRSHSAEPMFKPKWQVSPLSLQSRDRLRRHPQWSRV